MGAKVIAVTGGPGGGKTTSMQAAISTFGEQVLVSPEVASILLRNGYPGPGEDALLMENWLHGFQSSVYPVQLNMENEYRALAEKTMARVILCDRGILDGAAYLGKGLEYFLQLFGITAEDAYSRYDQVVHIESLAVSDQANYLRLRSSNPARYESPEQAAAIDAAIQEAWRGHPDFVVIKSHFGIAAVISEVITLVSSYLTREVESKFLLPTMPGIALGTGKKVRQGYLPVEQGEVRLRQMGDEYYLTIKGSGLQSRNECERRIDAWAFEQLWPSTEGRRIEKTRYFIPYAGYTLELDLYHGKLAGLVTLECEFSNEDEQANFRLPEWAAHATDITKVAAYKNLNLATHGLPK